jgi:hypothetical protein
VAEDQQAFFEKRQMKVGELIDLRRIKMIQKASVAAGKEPKLRLGVLGIEIGQTQSTGDTSRVERLPTSMIRRPLS